MSQQLEVLALRQLRAEGLCTEEQYQADLAALIAEIRDVGPTMAPERAIKASLVRPMTKSEIQAAKDAAVKAALATRKTFMGARSSYMMGVKPSKAVAANTPMVVRAPLAPTTAEMVAARVESECAAIRAAFVKGAISLAQARDRIKVAKAGQNASAMVCKYCHGDAILKRSCQPCGGLGTLTTAIPDRLTPALDIRPEGMVYYTLYSASGEPGEQDARSGDSAIKDMIAKLAVSNHTRATLDPFQDPKTGQYIQPVILTLHEHRFSCPACAGKGQAHAIHSATLKIVRCGECNGDGLVYRPRTTRLFFKNADDAHKAGLLAMTEDGFKRSLGMSCHKCSGKGCAACGDRGIIRITAHHWVDSGESISISSEIRRSDLVRQTQEKRNTCHVCDGDGCRSCERSTRIGGIQTMTRPSTDPKWAMGRARHSRKGPVTILRPHNGMSKR